MSGNGRQLKLQASDYSGTTHCDELLEEDMWQYTLRQHENTPCVCAQCGHGFAGANYVFALNVASTPCVCTPCGVVLQEHTMWHEALSRAVFEEDEALQEKRML
eukprot:scaffold221219_cov30-Tisochrysis_lutea.AAC.1